MAETSFSDEEDWDFSGLDAFRELADLAPPPLTLSIQASRLVDLLDDFHRLLLLGWKRPKDVPQYRFVPVIFPDWSYEDRIIRYLHDFGFTGDAQYLSKLIAAYNARRQQLSFRPDAGDKKGWKEFKEESVHPLLNASINLSHGICDIRKMLLDAGTKGWVTHAEGTDAPHLLRDGSEPTPEPRRELKRSTVRGEAHSKMIAALTKHHEYADGGCLNYEPIGSNDLARLAGVSKSSASEFFNKEFGRYLDYRFMCSHEKNLLAAIKMLNGEFRPSLLNEAQQFTDGEPAE